MTNDDRNSVWFAREFLRKHVIRYFAEDDFYYDKKTGLYATHDRSLPHAVQTFLCEVVGVERVTTGLVRSVCEAIRNDQYLPR